MVVLPPGTLLQLMYLRERIRQIPSGQFIEIGPGSGDITRLLLDHGWSGCSYDLEARTIASLKERFAKEIAEHRFMLINDDYLSVLPPNEKVDLVISCMVMEHLEDDAQNAFMQQSAACLKKRGVMIGLVPSSPVHWGIEDDIAGHCRRYTRNSIETLVSVSGWKMLHIVGLTFPISNLLLPVSNFLVNKSERSKLELSPLDRTKQSGRRQVKFKTYFPAILGLLLNKYTLFPLYILQKLFAKSEHALVLYFEAQPSPTLESVENDRHG
ncbi:MAG: class I SAM-dependent methyltransferase [Syntrophales bacterium]